MNDGHTHHNPTLVADTGGLEMQRLGSGAKNDTRAVTKWARCRVR